MEELLPTARVKTISYQLLRDGHLNEALKLLDACREDGLFYLDMEGAALNIQEAIEEIFTLEEKLFALPEDEKMQFDIDKLSPRKLNGYKPTGRNRGEIAGNRDGFESYALPKDGILGLTESAFPRPPIVDAYMPALRTFTRGVSAAASIILSSLSTSLSLPPDSSLQNVHRTQRTTPDLIRLLKYQSLPISERGASHIPHTDLGSMTFLHTRQPGLEILSSKTNVWESVKPLAKHAIVNLGDGLVLLSNGYFHSCLHRVKAPPGEAMQERYSFAYFLRAEDETPMRPMKALQNLTSKKESVQEEKAVLTSAEWLQRKYLSLRGNTWKKENSWMLTAGRQVK
ncbi:MAG: hypothetical protein MMC33_000934 [Icmadophila ericetorum]|nr:hypothetical protein [Icmadophila ericetorum]